MPSEGRIKIWEVIWYDVLYQLKSRLSILSMNHLQIYNTIVEVAAGVFGGDKDKPEPIKINDLSPENALHAMNRVFEMAGSR